MKRSIPAMIVAFLGIAGSGFSQSLVTTTKEDASIYPLIIALIMLIGAIFTRLISKHQSRKGNSI